MASNSLSESLPKVYRTLACLIAKEISGHEYSDSDIKSLSWQDAVDHVVRNFPTMLRNITDHSDALRGIY